MFSFSFWQPNFRTTLTRKSRRGSRKWRTSAVLKVEQLEDRVVPSVTINHDYAGLNFSDSGGYVPPDSNGAVGPTSYIETVNQTLRLHTNKATGGGAVTADFSTFFASLPAADSGGSFSDPVVVYDDNVPGQTPTTGRFIVLDQNVNPSTGKSVIDLAVSKTPNPTTLTAADWYFLGLRNDEAGPLWADYPGNLGYNKDALVVTFNMFQDSGSGGAYAHSQIVAIDINSLITGTTLTAGTNAFITDFASGGRPAAMHDAAAGAPMWIVEQGGGNTVKVTKMTNVLSSSPTLTATTLNVNAYVPAPTPLNPNGSSIASADGRMLKAAVRNNTLVATHNVGISANQGAARWYSINVAGGTPTLRDQGNVTAGPNTYLVYPAIDINSAGAIGLTFVQSGTDSPTDYMSMWVTGRKTDDPAGTMQTPVRVSSGTGGANNTDGREGDLSGINVDPVDGTFWAVAEYTDAAGDWGQAIANFKVDDPLSITPSTLPQTTAGINYNQTITVNGGSKPFTTFAVNNFNGGTTGLTASAFTTIAAAGLIVINGTPTAAGTITFRVDVTDTPGATLTKNYTITVQPALTISPTTLPQTTSGTNYNQTITVSGGASPYTTFAVNNFNAGGTGFTASMITASAAAGTVVVNGTPTSTGTISFTVDVVDSAGASISQNYSINVYPPLLINPPSLPTTTAGINYNQTITVSGGTPAYTTFSVTGFTGGGTGLTSGAITTNAGAGTVVITGTPTSGGTVSFTVNVVDSVGTTLTKNYTITVNPALTISPTTLPPTTAGVNYNQPLTISGGTKPYASVAVNNFNGGTTGLTAAAFTVNTTAGTVVINGTPGAAGTISFTVNASDSLGATLTQNYTITVNPPLSITPLVLPSATAKTNYNRTLTISGGTLPYASVAINGFNAGSTGLTTAALTTNTSAGTVTITGTPTAAGTLFFTVDATDSVGATLSQVYALTVNPVLSLLPTSLPQATAAAAYNQTLTIRGGTTPYTTVTVTGFNAGGTGLTAAAFTTNATAGAVGISGTPGAAGTVTFTVNATDSAGATFSQQLSLMVNPPLSITPPTLPQTTAGTNYNQTLTIKGGTTPYNTITINNFNNGTTGLTASALTTNAAAGIVVIFATPPAAGTVTFAVVVTDAVGATLSQNYSFTVNAVLGLSPATLPDATIGAGYNQALTVFGGTGAITFSVSQGFLPAGVALNSSTGVLSGTPTATGAFSFTITATDTTGASVSRSYSGAVNSAVTLTPTTLPAGTVSLPYAQIIAASNGTGSINLAVSNVTGAITGLLIPPGGTNSVAISGTPAVSGVVEFDLAATDSAGQKTTRHYTLTVNASTTTAPPTSTPPQIQEPPSTSAGLSGVVFLDLNVNGVRDGNEPALSGQIVFLDVNNNGQIDASEPSTATNGSGTYAFADLAAGTYKVALDPRQASLTASNVVNKAALVTLVTGQSKTQDFAVIQFSPAAPVFARADLTNTTNTDADVAWIRGMYRVVLGRDANGDLVYPTGQLTTEVKYWLNQLNSGLTRQTVAYQIINSQEHRQKQVAYYYQTLLHRNPLLTGDTSISYWVDILRSGASEGVVIQGIIDSGEFQQRYPDKASMVRDLYISLLGRPGSETEVTAYAQQLASGTYKTIGLDFVRSPESARLAVEGFYIAALHRLPDSFGSNFWVGLATAATNALTLGQVEADILGGTEFVALTKTSVG